MSSASRRPSPRPRPGPSAVPDEAPTVPDAPSAAGQTSAAGETSVESQRARRKPVGAMIRGARDVRTAQRERAAAPGTEPRFDPGSWLGAIIVMGVVTAALWVVQIVNATQHLRLDRRFGIVPREVHGLWGVLLSPFLHASYRDMLSDTLPVLLIGWVVLLAGVRIWLAVTAVVVVVGGALTWLIGPDHLGHEATLIVGSSGLVFGWIGYLVARAIFSRKIKWIVTAAMVLLVFGALLGQLVPVSHSQEAWQWHVASFVAGVGVAALLHPHRGSARAERRRKTASAVS